MDDLEYMSNMKILLLVGFRLQTNLLRFYRFFRKLFSTLFLVNDTRIGLFETSLALKINKN